MNPLISVIVPIYNTSAYLRECLLSIRRQTYTNLQVIMVDDGSTDNSADIAKEFTSDSRFILISQTNAGLSAARNRGLQSAEGQWIAFVDSDDFLDTDFYNKLIFTPAAEQSDIILCGYTECNADGKAIRHRVPKTPYQFVSACTRITKRDFLERNKLSFQEGYVYEDVVFSIDTWRAHPNMLLTNNIGYQYRLRQESITGKKHPIRPLFKLINQRQCYESDIKLYFIILYTKLRLLFHFAFNRR